MCMMTQLVNSAIYHVGKSFNDEDDTKICYILGYLEVCWYWSNISK